MKEINEIEMDVDHFYGLQKAVVKQKHSRAFKIVGVLIVAFILTASVTATYLTYFAEFDVKLTTVQGTMVDGLPYNEAVFTMPDTTLKSGCCMCTSCHTITNDGCDPITLDFATFNVTNPAHPAPLPDGISVHIKECGEIEPTDCHLTSLSLKALDGVAEWDDFTVHVNGVLVFTYDAVGGGENWIQHTINLIPFDIECIEHNIIKITCLTGPWTYFNPYGQLAIDTIALYCDNGCPACPPVLCDSVDIGNVASEGAHAMTGWGPIEPATHGGTYGGILNCRTTWFWTQGDVLTNPVTIADPSWATLELTCDCPEPKDGVGGNCESPEITLPMTLHPGDSVDFCICYKAAAMMGDSGPTNLQTKIIPASV